jgi:hypothetical protein
MDPVTQSASDTVAGASRVAAMLRATGDADAERYARALDDWLAGAPWDAAVGVAGGWRAEIRADARAAALNALAVAHAPLCGRPLAEAITTAVRRYEASSWPWDRKLGRRPPGLSGAAYDFLLASPSLSADRVRKLLGNRNGLPVAVAITHRVLDVSDMETTRPDRTTTR